MSALASTLDRVARSLRNDGLGVTLANSARFAFLKVRSWRRAWWLRRNGHSADAVFTEIYRKNYWGNAESVSGYGSTLSNTAELRNDLLILFREFSIAPIL